MNETALFWNPKFRQLRVWCRGVKVTGGRGRGGGEASVRVRQKGGEAEAEGGVRLRQKGG